MNREIIDYTLPELLFNIKAMSSNASGKYRSNHSHVAIELVHVNKGSIYAIINNEEVILNKGETILINSYVIHRLRAENEFEAEYIQVDISKYTNINVDNKYSIIDDYINSRNMIPYIICRNNELTDIFLQMKNEAEKKPDGFQLYLRGCFFHLAAFMQRNCMNRSSTALSQSAINKIVPVIMYVQANYKSPLTLDNLSALIHCDKFSLCKLFKSATGGTIVDYINFVRLRKAYSLLLSTDKSILDISLECGFASVQYFNRCFKQNAGCTPSAYRTTKLNHI